MNFVIGSTSQRKIDVAKKIISEYFKNQFLVEGYAANSQVPETPWDKQTFDGARNRALDAKSHASNAEHYIGLESGLLERYGHIYEEAWCVIISQNGEEYFGYSSGLKVPDYILKRMDELKVDHSGVMTILEKESGNLPNDTWGSYSGGTLLREVSLEEAIRNALIQITAPKESFYRK
ncbi:MAG: inosine/xanthosine triphosphatase [bacterium]|nr:inosine/xanthosine triphosphatase [bacterium]